MKKKNLAILLLLPYVISLLGVITVNLTLKTFKIDISHIEWDYSDMEVFKLEDHNVRYRLEARGVTPYNYAMADGNNLVWFVENQDGSEAPYARIDEENGEFYLVPLAEGMVTLTCSNEKETVTRRTTAIIYKNSVIVIRTAIQSSQNNVDPKIYYGQYDLSNGHKTPAKVGFNIMCVPDSVGDNLTVSAQNCSFDMATQTLSLSGAGAASFTLSGGTEAENTATSSTYSFEVVADGVNVYTYDDLLNCTNRSQNGEIVVLRKSFESLKNAYVFEGTKPKGALVKKANNVEAFGKYDTAEDKYSFVEEVYRFETTYNQEYIKQWNDFAKDQAHYNTISNELLAGIHVQKDFYGNGYTLNLHNLAYPYKSQDKKDEATGEFVAAAYLADDNLFRGPLPFYALGNPNSMPLVKAFGQDNVGMYVDGNNITVNDVNLKSCDFGNSFSNLDYVGTAMDVHGNNITVKNSVVQNAKTVMRVYSAHNMTLENCMLQNARTFLLSAGSNEWLPIDSNTKRDFVNASGQTVHATLNEFLASNAPGDSAMSSYLLGSGNSKQMLAMLQSLQAAMNDAVGYGEILPSGGSINVKDTLFYRSGISSISMESYFNGPFLYSASPSLLPLIFSLINSVGGDGTSPAIPMVPKNVSGISYPVQMTVSGQTKFYDYKTVDDMELQGLIEENISTFIQQNRDFFQKNIAKYLGDDVVLKENWSIDDIFPLRHMLYDTQNLYNGAYLNTAVAFYGGAMNRSTVVFEDVETQPITENVDWIGRYLRSSENGSVGKVEAIMQRTVTVVTGFDSFRFVCPQEHNSLFNKTPSVSTLRNNLKR